MAKLINLEIKNCSQCPFSFFKIGDGFYCRNKQTPFFIGDAIKDAEFLLNEIHSECPLEDEYEKKEPIKNTTMSYKIESEKEKHLLKHLIDVIRKCEFQDNPNGTYLEGREVENARLAIYLQQLWIESLDNAATSNITEFKITFIEGNDITYFQDHFWFKGVPHDIPFSIKELSNNGVVLIADGYGEKGNYGNGAILISKNNLPFYFST